jgi:putative ABC transport system permease protein
MMILQQTLVFYPIILSLYISYRILKITDLSADGVYVLGAAAFAKTLIWGPLWATLFAALSGLIAGSILAMMQRRNYVHHLITGILMTFMMYSVNFEFMGRPNLSLIGQPTLLKMNLFSSWVPILIITNIILVAIIGCVLSSSAGLKMRAFGLQPHLLQTYGLNPEKYRMLGLMLGSMSTAISGSLFAQINGFVDLNMGVGIALVAIGSIMVGQKILPHADYLQYRVFYELTASFVGIFSYFSLLAILMRFGVQPVHLKFFIGIALYLSMRFQSRTLEGEVL